MNSLNNRTNKFKKKFTKLLNKYHLGLCGCYFEDGESYDVYLTDKDDHSKAFNFISGDNDEAWKTSLEDIHFYNGRDYLSVSNYKDFCANK